MPRSVEAGCHKITLTSQLAQRYQNQETQRSVFFVRKTAQGQMPTCNLEAISLQKAGSALLSFEIDLR